MFTKCESEKGIKIEQFSKWFSTAFAAEQYIGCLLISSDYRNTEINLFYAPKEDESTPLYNIRVYQETNKYFGELTGLSNLSNNSLITNLNKSWVKGFKKRSDIIENLNKLLYGWLNLQCDVELEKILKKKGA